VAMEGHDKVLHQNYEVAGLGQAAPNIAKACTS
jgi:hypothetical protein